MQDASWMIIVGDGHHVWLGRNSDPSDAEIEAASAQLNAKALTGWLAVLKGDYWSRKRPLEVMLVRQLSQKGGDWESALQAWRDKRIETLTAAE